MTGYTEAIPYNASIPYEGTTLNYYTYTLKCQSALDNKLYFIPDTGAWQAGFAYNDAGGLELDYAIGGVNEGVLLEDSVIIAYCNGVEMANGRWHIRAASGEDVGEDGYTKWIGPSIFAALDKVLVLGGPTQSIEATVDFANQTIGYILNYLFAAAQARGAMLGFSWNFTASVDSSGNPWSGLISRQIPVGTKYSDLLRALAEQGLIEFEMQGMQVRVYVNGNMGQMLSQSVELRAGIDYSETPFRKSIEERADFILVSGDEGKVALVDSGTYDGPFGREEVSLTASTTDTGVLGLVGATYSSANAATRVEYTRKCVAVPGRPKHGIDYKCGDIIGDRTKASRTTMRVREMVIDVDTENNIEVALTLNDKFYDTALKNQIRLDNLLGGVSTGGIPTPTPAVDKTVPAKPTGVNISSVAYNDDDGRTRAAMTIDWNAPTTNTDGSAITDLGDYEYQWRYATGSVTDMKWRSNRVATNYAVVVNLNPNRAVEAKVQAWDQNGHPSGYTVVATGTTANDTTAPSTPALPTLSSLRGNIDVVHDWTKSGGGALESDTYSLEVHVSQTSNFTPSSLTYYGSLLMAGRLTITGLALNANPYYVKVIAVDRTGNKSAPSGQASITLNYISATDLAAALNTKIDTAFANAQAALLLPSKVNNPTRSGTVANWAVVSGTGSIAIDTQDFYGQNIRAMKITATDSTQVASDYFEVDTTKAYEVRAWVKDPVDPGNANPQFYIGATIIDPAGANANVDQYTLSSGATASQGNFYFHYSAAETAAGQWREVVGYVFPYNSDWNDVGKLGTNNLFNARFQQNNQRMRLRLLNWSNTGTSRDLWVGNITVTEMALADVKSAGVLEKWRVTGTTSFDGGMVAADTIDASVAVRAHTVGADELLVGGVTNLLPNGAGEYRALGGQWAAPINFDSADKPAGFAGSFRTNAGQSTYTPPVLWTEVEPGEKFVFEVWAKAAVAGSVLYVELRDQDNALLGGVAIPGETFAGNASYPVAALAVPTSWTRYSAEVTALATTNRIKLGNVFFNHSSGSVTNTTVWIAARMRARARGRLIVDGDIVARHFAAEAVDTNALKAGAVSTEKLALGVRGTNLVPDPSFEDTQPTVSPQALPATASLTRWYRDTATGTGAAAELRRQRGRSGAWALSFYLGGAGTVTAKSGMIPVIPGQTYKFSYYAVADTSAATPVFELYGGAGTGTVNSLQTLVADTDLPTSLNILSAEPYDPVMYQAFTYDYVVPAGINYVQVRIGSTITTGSGSITFDDIALLQKGSTSTEVTAAGIRLFDEEGLEVGAFVSNRPNYFTVTRSGATVASISEDGEISGYTGAFSGDVESANYLGDVPGALSVGGTDYAERLAALPQGIVAQVYRGGSAYNVTKIRTEYGIYEISFTQIPGRFMRVTASGGQVSTNGTTGQVSAIMRARMTVSADGSVAPGIGSTLLRGTRTILSASTGGYTVSLPPLIAQGNFIGGATTPQVVRILFTLNASNADASTYLDWGNGAGGSFPTPIECIVEDLGPDVPDTFLNSTGGGTLFTGGTDSGGGTTATGNKKTYVQTWTANSSQTRRGSSVYGNNTVNTSAPTGYNLAGYYSGSNGNQYTYLGFTGNGSLGQSINTAIAGATITKVELYVRNAKFYANSGGSQRFSMTTLGSMPSSGAASATQGNNYTGNVGFTPGQGKWITLPNSSGTTAGATLLAGGRVAVIGPGSSNSNSYYSTWYDHVGSGAPQLRITYIK